MWFVEFLLCTPNLGPNLRNEVAHGNATQGELSPARILLVWLFIIRLTFFAAEPAGVVE